MAQVMAGWHKDVIAWLEAWGIDCEGACGVSMDFPANGACIYSLSYYVTPEMMEALSCKYKAGARGENDDNAGD